MKIAPLFTSLLLTCGVAAGCSVDTTPTQAPAGDAARGQLGGKADTFTGSCAVIVDGVEASSCGQQAVGGNCFCDAKCADYGDCCLDAAETCAVNECLNSGSGCRPGYDCEVAAPGPNSCVASQSSTCGGIAGLQCDDSEYCDYDQALGCGIADGSGVCHPRPQLCTADFQPVCGCDGKTYSNACRAAANGADVAQLGKCDDEPSACGGLLGLACGADEYCDYDESTGTTCGTGDGSGVCRTRPQICTQVVIPVCACDGTTYSNQCHAHRAGVDVASGGPCNTPPAGPSCQGHCGESSNGCWCDDKCVANNDCCSDYQAVCQ